MYIGHVNLAKSFNGAGEHFVTLVETLQQLGMKQYVVVRNVDLAKRLDIVSNVTVGPTVRSAVTAHSLIPDVDIVHIHDRSGWQAGLLLILTKSIPFVLTATDQNTHSRNPIVKSVYKRAFEVIPESVTDATEVLQVYTRAAQSLRVPTMLL